MRQSQLFTKTRKTPPKDEESLNAKFLERAGFVQKLMAGVYTFLPLGLRVLNKIENIVREEMNKAGGAEVLMPTLQPKENWETTGRWEGFDALFKVQSKFAGEYALGPTHEEVIYPLLKNYLSSYKDLPIKVYQIQTKFRDEKRAKSGLLRGREFRMKDMYSFHGDEADRDNVYSEMKKAYEATFKRLGLDALPTSASGGTFSDNSIEFQVPCEAGEDIIYVCNKCHEAVNREIAGASGAPKCPVCGGGTTETKAIEVGNIFPLKEKYAKDFNLVFKDKEGKNLLVWAGCYGLGTTRAMGAIAEVHNDQYGLIWPKAVAPFSVHVIGLKGRDETGKEAEKIYNELIADGIDALLDDRDASAGEKLADADLIGIPVRILVSDRTLEKKSVEIKMRNEAEAKIVSISEIKKYVG